MVGRAIFSGLTISERFYLHTRTSDRIRGRMIVENLPHSSKAQLKNQITTACHNDTDKIKSFPLVFLRLLKFIS